MAALESKKWYIVNTLSGYEKRVASEIERQVETKGLSDYIEDIVIPVEEIVEVKKGKKTKSERKFFPGYVMVKMLMNDDSWHLIKNIPRVTGFLGSKDKPQPISDSEAQRIFKQVQEGIDKPKHSVAYELGESVKIIDGPFESFTGVVEDVDDERSKLKVSVSIFGRSTPVELEFVQVDKL